MPILPHAGSWFGLPDFGITEKIGSYLGVPQNPGTGGTGLANLIARQPNPAPYIPSISNNVLGTNTGQNMSYVPAGYNPPSYSRPTGGGGGQAPVSSAQNGVNAVNQQLNQGNNFIEQDFQNYMNELGNQESNLRAQGPITEQGINAAYAPAISSFQNQGQQKIGALNTQSQQVATQTSGALQQARDLFRQVQQQNIAQLSGAGLSSSSVAEALAERLGVETARRIGSISQNATDVQNNINTEKINTEAYVKDRISGIEQEKAARIADVRQQLINGLNQINLARQSAQTDKAKLRYDLLTQAQNQIGQLQAQAQAFQQKLYSWGVENQQKLNTVANYDWVGYFQNAAQNAPQIGSYWNALSQQGISPSVSVATPGGARITLGPKKPEDPYAVASPLYGGQ